AEHHGDLRRTASGMMALLDRYDVAIVIADLGSGGAQRMTDNLVRRFLGLGLRVAVITLASAASDHYSLPSEAGRIALDRVAPSQNWIQALGRNLMRIVALRAALSRTGAGVVLALVGE